MEHYERINNFRKEETAVETNNKNEFHFYISLKIDSYCNVEKNPTICLLSTQNSQNQENKNNLSARFLIDHNFTLEI